MNIVSKNIISKNRKDQALLEKQKRDLEKKSDKIEQSLTISGYNEDLWRQLQIMLNKIEILSAQLDGSFYEGESIPQFTRISSTNQFNRV